VFLDACRNNPLAERLTRGGERGLAPIQPGRNANTLVMFATAPDEVAEDGTDRNSPFTSALLKHIANPEDVEVMLKKVMRDVTAVTKNRQRPESLSRLSSSFQFPPTIPGKVPAPVPYPQGNGDRADREFWAEIRASQVVRDYESYLKAFPDGLYVPLAKKRMADLSRGPKALPKSSKTPEEECEIAKMEATPEAYRAFIEKHPKHPCAGQLRRVLSAKADEDAWQRAVDGSKISDYRVYLEKFPTGFYADIARRRVAELQDQPSVRSPPPPLVNSPPPPSASFARQFNRWVDGDGFDTTYGGTIDTCEARCRRDDRCQMYEFYFGKDTGPKCNLYDHQRWINERVPSAHVGFKQ
jgi:hypothetical protein